MLLFHDRVRLCNSQGARSDSASGIAWGLEACYDVDPLWAELINSDWRDYRGSGRREDRLGNDEWLGRFLARADWQGELLPDAGQRAELRQLRGLLGKIVETVRSDGEIAAADLAALNRVLAAAPVLRRLQARPQRPISTADRDMAPASRSSQRNGFPAGPLEPGEEGHGLVLVAVSSGIEQVAGAVAASFAAMLALGEWSRIKVCTNPDCGWVMYDESRNRSRRWCDKTECGNLIKVRRHRRKRRAIPR